MISPLDEKLKTVKWGEFRILEIFNVRNTRNILSTDIIAGSGTIPYLCASAENNGVSSYISYDENLLEEGNCIFIGGKTFVVSYQKEDFYSNDSHNLTLYLKNHQKRIKSIQVFIISCITKCLGHKYTWGNSISHKKIKDDFIFLPVNEDGEIDFDFMESFIRELEEERVRELSAYLTVSGLADTTLTANEEAALLAFERMEWQEFKIGDLYSKVELNNKKFDKRKDTRSEPSAEFPLPVVNAKHGDNGIMFYGNDDIFDSAEMTIDIIQNGAIATGDVYPQPQRTGVLWDAYLIKAKAHEETRLSLFFNAASIHKSIKQKFSYEFKATWDRVQKEKIFLPVHNGQPDYTLMQDFISAIQKLVIKDVVRYADEKISTTRSIIN